MTDARATPEMIEAAAGALYETMHDGLWRYYDNLSRPYFRKLAAAALEAALRSPLPEGWKLVPMSPTDEMLTAAIVAAAMDDSDNPRVSICAALTAALAAAPAPPSAGPGTATTAIGGLE